MARTFGRAMREVRNASADLQNEIKSQKTKTFLYKLGTLVGVITSGYLFLK
jgi:Sec-independent protein translocase protein TatA